MQTVERALELYGAPVYVRKEIVHNKHVVEELAKRGAIFVEEETEVPEGEMVVFSAHGVAPAVHENAAARNLRTIDATCPLVTKVHVSARRFAAEGYTIVMIGHEGHEEVEGTTGEAPDSIVLIETADEVESLEVADPTKVAFITQTTLSVDETAEVIAALRAKFPAIVSSKSDDICYATTNRQIAVKQLARECELVLVIGSTNSSNSNRLVEVAREHGAASHLIDNHTQVEEEWLEGVETVGITSGASAPEELVERLVELFRERGAEDVSELRTVHEDVRFMLPKEIREALRRGSPAAKLTDQTRSSPAGSQGERGGPRAARARPGCRGAGRRSSTGSTLAAVELDQRARRCPRPWRRRRRPRTRVASSGLSALALQGCSQEPPGKSSGVGGITFAPGESLGRSGRIGSGSERSASSSRSSSWIAISVPRYSPSPKWNQLSAPPVVQRKRLGQPSQP